MAKSKKSKNKSDKLYAKRNKPTEKKLNPFELHINKEKHAILNKMEKGARGFVSSKILLEKNYVPPLSSIGIL